MRAGRILMLIPVERRLRIGRTRPESGERGQPCGQPPGSGLRTKPGSRDVPPFAGLGGVEPGPHTAADAPTLAAAADSITQERPGRSREFLATIRARREGVLRQASPNSVRRALGIQVTLHPLPELCKNQHRPQSASPLSKSHEHCCQTIPRPQNLTTRLAFAEANPVCDRALPHPLDPERDLERLFMAQQDQDLTAGRPADRAVAALVPGDLRRHGHLDAEDGLDRSLGEDPGPLTHCQIAAVQGLASEGPAVGQRQDLFGMPADPGHRPPEPLCADFESFSLQWTWIHWTSSHGWRR